MGLLDSMIGALGNSGADAGGDAGASFMQLAAGLMQNGAPGGGLGGLLQSLQQGGLGDVVSSWVGSGQNLPITAEQLQSVLGSEQLQGLAQQLGLSGADIGGQLAQLLPQAVDHLTPNGELPGGGDLSSLVSGFLKT